MSSNKTPIIAVVFALVGGALLLINSILSLILTPYMTWLWTWGYPMCGMMWRWGGPMMAWAFPGMMAFISLIGLIAGFFLIVGGLMIHANSRDAQLWGTIVLLFSVVGFLSGGGFLIGSIIGILGGIIALTTSQSAKNLN